MLQYGAEWSDRVKLGPMGSDLVPMGSDWVISHTCAEMSLTRCTDTSDPGHFGPKTPNRGGVHSNWHFSTSVSLCLRNDARVTTEG